VVGVTKEKMGAGREREKWEARESEIEVGGETETGW